MNLFVAQSQGFRLATTHVLYHLPDNPGLLQAFSWQTLDMVPDFPRIRRFLDFWEREIDGKLHSVTVAAAKLVMPGESRYVTEEYRLH